jgi:uncharacterized protein (DUF1810 family)
VSDTFVLERFVLAQAGGGSYTNTRAEISNGEKRSHWSWFVFPQLAGLGLSHVSRTYAISGLDEACAFLTHPVLGSRLHEVKEMTNQHASKDAREIFRNDDVKFRSSMTLFSSAAPTILSLVRRWHCSSAAIAINTRKPSSPHQRPRTKLISNEIMRVGHPS